MKFSIALLAAVFGTAIALPTPSPDTVALTRTTHSPQAPGGLEASGHIKRDGNLRLAMGGSGGDHLSKRAELNLPLAMGGSTSRPATDLSKRADCDIKASDLRRFGVTEISKLPPGLLKEMKQRLC